MLSILVRRCGVFSVIGDNADHDGFAYYYKPGEVVSLTCNLGFISHDGNFSSDCNEDGTWTTEPLNCHGMLKYNPLSLCDSAITAVKALVQTTELLAFNIKGGQACPCYTAKHG